MGRGGLAAWALVATALLVPALIGGYWLGRTEARGFLGGIDTALDKISLSVDRLDRTAERGVRRQESRAPTFNVFPPADHLLPPVTHRDLVDGEVIDL
jgi:hypothetical protein